MVLRGILNQPLEVVLGLAASGLEASDVGIQQMLVGLGEDVVPLLVVRWTRQVWAMTSYESAESIDQGSRAGSRVGAGRLGGAQECEGVTCGRVAEAGTAKPFSLRGLGSAVRAHGGPTQE